MNPAYSDKECATVRKFWPSATRAELLAALPGRTWNSIQHQARRLYVRRLSRIHQGPYKSAWSPEHLELLRAHYPKEGSGYVADLVGRGTGAVTMMAKKLGIRRQWAGPMPRVAKPRPVRAVAVKVAKTPASKASKSALAKQQPEPVAIQPVKRSPVTPVLNARAEARRRAEKEQQTKPKPFVTVDQLKAAPQPVRWAYTCAANRGPAAATEAFHAAMQKYKQAA